uniref:Uncharacterized protein n=1 Tax=Arundo donax TaxID=35708 RepID=A0A0A8YVK0_ARUDO
MSNLNIHILSTVSPFLFLTVINCSAPFETSFGASLYSFYIHY